MSISYVFNKQFPYTDENNKYKRYEYLTNILIQIAIKQQKNSKYKIYGEYILYGAYNACTSLAFKQLLHPNILGPIE